MSDNDRLNGWEAGSGDAMEGKQWRVYPIPDGIENEDDYREGYNAGYDEYHDGPPSEEENKAWRAAYYIADVGASNPRGVAFSLDEHSAAVGSDHPAVIAIAGHLAFLRGESAGPDTAVLAAVRENAERLELL